MKNVGGSALVPGDRPTQVRTGLGRGRGTGQGLALSHRVIVGKHRGEIDVKTGVGNGTVFTLRLPLRLKAEKV